MVRAPVWISPVEQLKSLTLEIKLEDKLAKPIAIKKVVDLKNSRLQLSICYEKPKYSEGDWVILRQKQRRGFVYECPGRVIYIHEKPNSREFFVYIDQPKGSRNMTSTTVKKALGGVAASITFKSESDRLIRSSSTAIQVLRLWKQHQGSLQ